MATCEIQWIDDKGRPTPDEQPAVGRVKVIAHQYHGENGHIAEIEESKWFNICAEHRAQMQAPGMQLWRFEYLSTEKGVVYVHPLICACGRDDCPDHSAEYEYDPELPNDTPRA